MIGRKNTILAAAMAAIVMLSGSLFATTIGFAQAAMITEEEHWKYRIDRWLWDEDRRRTYGQITPQVIIQNETADRLEGFVADANGTRLDMYDGEQIVHIRYLSNNSGASGWQMAGRVHDGFFAIDIPERHRKAEIVRIFIGTNEYTVNNASPSTPPTQVSINSAILNYKINSTLDEIETAVAATDEEPKPLRSVYQRGSLIDWILSRNGMLPVGSSDPGK